MLKIVSVPAQALANIRKFEDELKGSPELQARLAYARAWYAYKDAGGWHFGPSKFIGYQDIDAATYLAMAEDTDGRRTEAQLKTFFFTPNSANPLHAELNSALVVFLAKYGKTPSTMARINVARDMRRAFSNDKSEREIAASAVVDLMLAVAKTLPEDHFKQLRNRLEDVWA
jgi:hypothetical protein